MKAVTKLNTQPQDAESTQKRVGHHNVTGKKKKKVSRVVRSARLCVNCQHSPSGTCRTTASTFPPRMSHHPAVRSVHVAATDIMIKLHSAVCWGHADVHGVALIALCTAPRIDSSQAAGLGNGFVIKSVGFTCVPTFSVTNFSDLDASCIQHVHAFRLAGASTIEGRRATPPEELVGQHATRRCAHEVATGLVYVDPEHEAGKRIIKKGRSEQRRRGPMTVTLKATGYDAEGHHT